MRINWKSGPKVWKVGMIRGNIYSKMLISLWIIWVIFRSSNTTILAMSHAVLYQSATLKYRLFTASSQTGLISSKAFWFLTFVFPLTWRAFTKSWKTLDSDRQWSGSKDPTQGPVWIFGTLHSFTRTYNDPQLLNDREQNNFHLQAAQVIRHHEHWLTHKSSLYAFGLISKQRDLLIFSEDLLHFTTPQNLVNNSAH